jgi:hypothetical protein
MPQVTLLNRAILFACAALLSACSTPSGASGVGVPAAPNKLTNPSLRADRATTMYVSTNSGVSVYARNGKFLRTVNIPATPLAVDSTDHLYAMNDHTVVDVYANQGKKLASKVPIKNSSPSYLLVDTSGNIYVRCGFKNVCEYGPRHAGFIRQLRGGLSYLALDNAGNLYATVSGNSVAVYAPGATSPERIITSGIDGPGAKTVDAQGNLYVANAFMGSERSPNISVYPPGGTAPTRSITVGLTVPSSMATDTKGNLYVLNECSGIGGCTNTENSVAIYAAGNSTPAEVITNGIDYPSDIAVDQSSTLYVSNFGETGAGTVTIYGGRSFSLLRTLTGIKDPGSIAVAN